MEIGKLADFVILEENPLANLKILYGTGAIKLTENNEIVRVGGVKYTVKDGIIYDSKKLLRDVKEMVEKEKQRTGFELKQPNVGNYTLVYKVVKFSKTDLCNMHFEGYFI